MLPTGVWLFPALSFPFPVPSTSHSVPGVRAVWHGDALELLPPSPAGRHSLPLQPGFSARRQANPPGWDGPERDGDLRYGHLPAKGIFPSIPLKLEVQARHRGVFISSGNLWLLAVGVFPLPACPITSSPCPVPPVPGMVGMGRTDLSKHFPLFSCAQAWPCRCSRGRDSLAPREPGWKIWGVLKKMPGFNDGIVITPNNHPVLPGERECLMHELRGLGWSWEGTKRGG